LNNHAAGMLAQGHVQSNIYNACDQTGDMLYYKDIEKTSFDFEDNRDHSNSGIIKSETLKAGHTMKRQDPINDLNFLQTLSEGTNEEDDSEMNNMQDNKNNLIESHIDCENLNELNCFLKANIKDNVQNTSKNNSTMKMSGSTANFKMRST
jgi:hypothetical protein